jgi:ribose 5-phosphate isomerase B
MTVLYIASDHAGFTLKETLKQHLAATHPALRVMDLGTHSEDSVDYPDYGFAAAHAVVAEEGARGIILCGSGIGISIAANRVAGARAALCLTPEMAVGAREHNNANILALGARLSDAATAKACVDAFLTTDFAGGRHENRVKKLG